MVFPRAFCRVVFSGTTLRGADIWSCSLSLDKPGFTEGQAVPDSLLQGLAAAWTKFHQSAGSAIHTSCEFRTVKANMIGTNGKYLSETATRFLDVTPVPGRNTGTSGTILPPQSALAVSLLTSVQRGLASRGRFYPPATQMAVGSDGYVDPAAVALLRDSAVTLLNDINAISDDFVVAVASETREGAIRPVRAVEVGNVMDTQRSRRSALRETYVAGDLAPA